MDFVFETRLRRPLAETYRFFSDPGNLALVLAGLPGFRLLRHDGSVAPGSETWIEAMTLGILPIVLGFEHVACEPGRCFSERLLHGPFTRFDHFHEFAAEDGGTVVRDTLAIELPWQFGGAAAMRLVVAPLVERLFAVRRLGTIRALEGDTAATVGR